MNKVKFEAMEKLPPPTSVEGMHSFLGQAGFYQYFIKDFFKFAEPLLTYWLKIFHLILINIVWMFFHVEEIIGLNPNYLNTKLEPTFFSHMRTCKFPWKYWNIRSWMELHSRVFARVNLSVGKTHSYSVGREKNMGRWSFYRAM